jgi:3-isopropylmalate/(R)-2-methylmalate dehydratase small subunit
MPGLQVHRGTTAVYNADNVDTDRIIPARFLSRVERQGYGELLFVDVRKRETGFPLDQPEAQGATLLVVGTNFGCGSSREHAVWAIQQAGYRVVIARKEADSPGYSDIFRQNAANCGLLLVELEGDAQPQLAAAGTGTEVTVDLVNQTVAWNSTEVKFDINPVIKDQILKGLDLIGTTLAHEAAIAEFEHRWDSFAPAP